MAQKQSSHGLACILQIRFAQRGATCSTVRSGISGSSRNSPQSMQRPRPSSRCWQRFMIFLPLAGLGKYRWRRRMTKYRGRCRADCHSTSGKRHCRESGAPLGGDQLGYGFARRVVINLSQPLAIVGC